MQNRRSQYGANLGGGEQAQLLLQLQWSLEQIASKPPISHQTSYISVYSEKAQGGTLWKALRYQKQKWKRYAGGLNLREQILNRQPLSDRPLHIEATRQVSHWECDTVIGDNRSGSACLNSFTPRDKETKGGLNRCRVVHGGGRRLRRTDRRGGQLGAHQGFSFKATSCSAGSSAQYVWSGV